MRNNGRQRRSKIVCTLGPSTNTYKKIRALAESGMNAARINFSHGTHKDHRKLIELVRKVSLDIGKPIAVIQDLQGPKIRVRSFKHGKVKLKNGSEFSLTAGQTIGDEKIVSVTHASLHKDVKSGDSILLDDGKLKLIVERIEGKIVRCRVIHGGTLSDNKGINLPGSLLSIKSLTDKDLEDLDFGLEMNVDFVAMSFVQKPEDVALLKRKIKDKGMSARVIAKIEKPQAVEDIDAIIDLADIIMIARGDLGVEMDTEEVPPIQKNIIKLCNKRGKPVITATQMLESMMNSPRPTRAEASDVANAVIDGSDAVMLSGETAAGKFPVEAVKTMCRIISLIEQVKEKEFTFQQKTSKSITESAAAIGYSACHAAHMVDAAAIICMTQTGSTTLMISRFRPDKPILGITPNVDTYNRTALYWGVTSFLCRKFVDELDDAIPAIFKTLKSHDAIDTGDRVVITAGLPFTGKKGGTNMLRIDVVQA